ncbi:MAG: HAMP domain-containing protein [Anaerolineae bacterium]|nr:HAMP domain-containing protein [Anaerolineae bacterium]
MGRKNKSIVVARDFENETTTPIIPFRAKPIQPSADYVSLRTRLLVPLFAVMLVIVTTGAYLVSQNLMRTQEDDEVRDVLVRSQTLSAQTAQIGVEMREEIRRITFTSGVLENVAAQNGPALQTLIEPLAELATLDLVIVTGADSQEILSLQRVEIDGLVDYTVAEKSDVSSLEPIFQAMSQQPRSGFVQTGLGVMLVTSGPIFSPTDQMMGIVTVGRRLDHVLALLDSPAAENLAVFAGDGRLLRTTLPDNEAVLNALHLPLETVNQTLGLVGQVPTENITLDGERYQVAYIPFTVDTQPIGVLGIYQPTYVAYSGDMARQLTSLTFATLTAAILIVFYLFTVRLLSRVNRVRRTAEALAAGQLDARSRLRANDEIGVLGGALDHFADVMGQQNDLMVKSLRRERRENSRLAAILESLPDGLIVLDSDGRVLMMNTQARNLIGGIRTLRSASFQQLTAATTETLGPALAPGLYAMGQPVPVLHQDRILEAQVAAIVTVTGGRLGKLVTLRDITEMVQREQRHEVLVEKLSDEVHLPVSHVAQDAALRAVDLRGTPTSDSLMLFAREIARNARAMQRIIGELRELNTINRQDLERGQKPILLSDVMWRVAAQWKKAAAAAEVLLEVRLPTEACYVLGDERRLRWAIGNVVDNAIKYSPPNSTIQITAIEQAEKSTALIRVEDQGVGILAQDLPNIFQRFYRGTPTLPDGKVIETPGTGQGLYLSRKIVRTHGGEMTLESIAGQGTIVEMSLPLTSPVTLEMPDAHETAEKFKLETREVELLKKWSMAEKADKVEKIARNK